MNSVGTRSPRDYYKLFVFRTRISRLLLFSSIKQFTEWQLQKEGEEEEREGENE